MHSLVSSSFAVTAGLLLALGAGGVRAEGAHCANVRPDMVLDYYSSRGCGFLQSVEQYHLGPGEKHLKANRFTQAYNDFRFILNQFPNHPQALLLVAKTCELWPARDTERGNRCNMAELFDRAIEKNPKASGTYVARGTWEHRAKQLDKAVANYQRAIALDPDSIGGHYNLALAYLDQKRYEEANAYAQRAYALGAPLPGLKNRLEQSGHWRPGVPPPAPAPADASGKATAPR
jgi:tetratricopeptide (TPR) repeat protein